MAPVESEVYKRVIENGEFVEDKLTNKCKVKPGFFGKFNEFFPVGLLVFCDGEDSRGTLQLAGSTDHLKVVSYLDEDDEEGVMLDCGNKPIQFFGPQIVAVESYRPGQDKVISFAHRRDHGQQLELSTQQELGKSPKI